MRLEYITDTDFKLFINNIFVSNVNYDSKEELMGFLKDLMVKINKTYGINVLGFYEVDIWILNSVGIDLFLKRRIIVLFQVKLLI